MKVFNLQKWLIQWLRRGSYRVPEFYSEAKNRARVARGRYQCQKCLGVFRNGEFQMDHTKPVIDPKRGFVGFDEYISRLYCGPSGLKLLCKACHSAKSARENKRRRKVK